MLTPSQPMLTPGHSSRFTRTHALTIKHKQSVRWLQSMYHITATEIFRIALMNPTMHALGWGNKALNTVQYSTVLYCTGTGIRRYSHFSQFSTKDIPG